MIRHLMRQFHPVLSVMALMLVSCSGHNYARLGKESVVNSFPSSYLLSTAAFQELEVPGVIDVVHHGDRIYCMTKNPDGLISVYDDESLEQSSAPFLRMGNGPGETLSPIPFRQMYFHEDGGELKATFFNMGTRLIDLNLSASVSAGTTVGEALGEVPGEMIGRGPLSLLDEDMYFFQYPEDQRGVRRGLWMNGEIKYTPAQEKLNAFALEESDGFLFNIFFSACAYSAEKKRFVEVSSMQNTINIYDMDGSFEKTISLYGPVSDYLELAKQGMDGISMTFSTVQAFKDFFVALYCERPLSHPSDALPVLMFFDWDGNPIREIKLPFSVSSFSLDVEPGILYCADQGSDSVMIADVSTLL